MDKIAKRLKTYIDTHPFDPGDSDCETVLDQLYLPLIQLGQGELLLSIIQGLPSGLLRG